MKSHIDLSLTLEADQDIVGILQYTRETYGETQAGRYERDLNRAFNRLRSFPEIGRRSSEDGSEREVVVRHHIVVYRLFPQSLIVLRVVHVRQGSRRTT